ncbi:MAG: heavy-metal-associated domain-containing protein [Eubacteriales bacterium]|jgi:copper chaperone
MGTAIIVAVLTVFGLIALKSYAKKLRSGCCGAGDSEAVVKVKDTDETHYPHHIELSVSGMTCKKCKQHVENAFNKRDGLWAQVDLKKGLAEVRAKKELTNFELRGIVSGAGYTVTGIRRIA